MCVDLFVCVYVMEREYTLSLSLSLSHTHTHAHRLSGYASSRVRTNVWSRQWTPQRQIFRMSAHLCTSCRYIFLKVDSTVVSTSLSQFVLVHKLLVDILNCQSLWIVRILWVRSKDLMGDCALVHKLQTHILKSRLYSRFNWYDGIHSCAQATGRYSQQSLVVNSKDLKNECTRSRYIFWKVGSTVDLTSMSDCVLVHKLLVDILNTVSRSE